MAYTGYSKHIQLCLANVLWVAFSIPSQKKNNLSVSSGLLIIIWLVINNYVLKIS
jgi:hypothetical protein